MRTTSSLSHEHENGVSEKTGEKIKPTEEKSSMGFISVRDFQLHAAVDDIAFQSVQADNLLIAAAVAEILLGNRPEGVAMRHGMDNA